jgi:hypothetical protein
MSRTHRSQSFNSCALRSPKTFNEIKQVEVSSDYYDSQYLPSIRNRYIPTAWDDKVCSGWKQTYHH